MSYCFEIQNSGGVEYYSLPITKKEDALKFFNARPDIVNHLSGEKKNAYFIINDTTTNRINVENSTLDINSPRFSSDLIDALKSGSQVFANQVAISNREDAERVVRDINDAFDREVVSYREVVNGRYQLEIDGVIDNDIYTTYSLTDDIVSAAKPKDLTGNFAVFSYEGFFKLGVEYKGKRFPINGVRGLYTIQSPFDGRRRIVGRTKEDIIDNLNMELRDQREALGIVPTKAELKDITKLDGEFIIIDQVDKKNVAKQILTGADPKVSDAVNKFLDYNKTTALLISKKRPKYDVKKDVAVINSNSSGDELFHELFHASTYNAIENNKELQDTIAYIIKTINKRYPKNGLKAVTGTDGVTRDYSQLLDINAIENGYSKNIIHEFVTNAFVNDDFKEFLKSEVYVDGLSDTGKSRNILQQLFDFILKAIGFNNKDRVGIMRNVIEALEYETNTEMLSDEAEYTSKEVDTQTEFFEYYEQLPDIWSNPEIAEDEFPFYTTPRIVDIARNLGTLIEKTEGQTSREHLQANFNAIKGTAMENIAYGKLIRPGDVSNKVAFTASFKRGDIINMPWMNWDEENDLLFIDKKNIGKTKKYVINKVSYSPKYDSITFEVLMEKKDGTIGLKWVKLNESIAIKEDDYTDKTIPAVNYIRRWTGVPKDLNIEDLEEYAESIRQDDNLFGDDKFTNVKMTYGNGKQYDVLKPKYGEFVTVRHWGESKSNNLERVKAKDFIQVQGVNEEGKKFKYMAPAVATTPTGVFIATKKGKMKFIKSDDIVAISYDLSNHQDIINEFQSFNETMKNIRESSKGQGDVYRLAHKTDDPEERIALFESAGIPIPPRFNPYFDSSYINGTYYSLDQSIIDNRNTTDGEGLKEGKSKYTAQDNLERRRYKTRQLSFGDWIEVSTIGKDGKLFKNTYPVLGVTDNQITYMSMNNNGFISSKKVNIARSVDSDGRWFDLVKNKDGEYTKKYIETKQYDTLLENIHVNNTGLSFMFETLAQKKEALKEAFKPENRVKGKQVTEQILDNHIEVSPSINNLRQLQVGDYIKSKVEWNRRNGDPVSYDEWMVVSGFREDGTIEAAGLAKKNKGNYHYYKKPIDPNSISVIGLDKGNPAHSTYIKNVHDEAKQVAFNKIIAPEVDYYDIPSDRNGIFTARGIEDGVDDYGNPDYRLAKPDEGNDEYIRVWRFVDEETGEIVEKTSKSFDFFGKKKLNLDKATRQGKIKALKNLKHGDTILYKYLNKKEGKDFHSKLYVQNIEDLGDGKIKLSYISRSSFNEDGTVEVKRQVLNADKEFFLDNIVAARLGSKRFNNLDKEGAFNGINKSKQSIETKSKADYEGVLMMVNKFKELHSDVDFKIYNNKEIDELSKLAGTSVADARAFELNGSIYINSDKASGADVVHEMGHIFMPIMKLKDPALYNKIMDEVENSEEYHIVGKAYPELTGEKLKEEAFLTMFGEQYDTNNTRVHSKEESKKRRGIISRFMRFIKSLFQKSFNANRFEIDLIQDTKFANTSIDQLINKFGDSMMKAKLNGKPLLATVSFSKEVLSLKKKLKENNMIMEECNG